MLREVFGCDYTDIAVTIERSEAACRQLAVRARRHMEAGRTRFEANSRDREKLAARFFTAITEGDVNGLKVLLAADVQIAGDSGGKAPALARAVTGAGRVARLLASVGPVFARIGLTHEPHSINGQAGAIARDSSGRVAHAIVLDIVDGQIHTIRTVNNPDKLAHLGPLCDASAIREDFQRARRHSR